MIYILAAILIFGVLIAVHELGHFLAAKACGVRVNEFAIGMGPALFKKTKGDTTYALRLLPIGGFCAMEGEEEDSDDPAALNNQGFWQKLLIFAAGALMNFLTGLVIILVLYAGVKAVNVPVIHGFADGCPLESASGLQVGDRILSIDGERVYTFSDVSLLLGRNKTGDFDLVIRRDGQKLRLENFHMERGEYLDQSGEKFTGFGLYFGAQELTFGGRLKYCWDQAVDFVRLVRLSLQMLITGEAPRGHRVHHHHRGRAVRKCPGRRRQHRVPGGPHRREPGGDEPVAPARSGRRQDLLPGGQRPVPAHHPQADPRQV